ncbi:MAG: type III pantothenate kinase [Robiginitalea sp.]|uniref:type III pantothenate kinase n=1 Tax=Robiginitalea sp. TaxID=1902411 RepID=UPI003C745689
MNLVVDAGNTQIKFAVFKGNLLLHTAVGSQEAFAESVKRVFDKYPGITDALISAVSHLEPQSVEILSVFCKVYVLSPQSRIPFKNSYATPATLGPDRIALATAAFYHNPNGNTLVIDAGTCITYDMVNDYGEYLGGAISPGLYMRYNALHKYTDKLPLLTPEAILDFIGNATETCMHSGVVNGISLEIDGVITQYRSRFRHLTVILTGGDAQFLSKRVKNTIFAHSNFLLEGLNQLLDYNKS